MLLKVYTVFFVISAPGTVLMVLFSGGGGGGDYVSCPISRWDGNYSETLIGALNLSFNYSNYISLDVEN